MRETFQEVDEELAACVERWLQKGTEDQGWVDSNNIQPGLLPILKCTSWQQSTSPAVAQGEVTNSNLPDIDCSCVYSYLLTWLFLQASGSDQQPSSLILSLGQSFGSISTATMDETTTTRRASAAEAALSTFVVPLTAGPSISC